MLKLFSDARGTLGSLEFSDLPFVPQRFYWVQINESEVRGKHAHKNLEQIIFVQEGTVKFRVVVGNRESITTLNVGDHIYLGPSMWREFESVGARAILGCLASAPYDEADYIRDFNKYLETFNEVL